MALLLRNNGRLKTVIEARRWHRSHKERGAEERIATLLILLFKRAAALQKDGGAFGVPSPLTQQHINDGLGLSMVHNKTLRKLVRGGLHGVEDGRLCLRDSKALARLADLYGDGKPPRRPLVQPVDESAFS